MPAPCRCCTHPERETLDAELRQGLSIAKAAKKYGLSMSSTENHRKSHLGISGSTSLAKAAALNAVQAGLRGHFEGRALLDEVRTLRQRADLLGAQAESAGDVKTALLAIRELTRLVELQGRLTLEASAGRAADIVAHPVYHEIVACILQALDVYPEARRAVEAALRDRLGQRAAPVSA